MKVRLHKILAIIVTFFSFLTISGVYATWQYFLPAPSNDEKIQVDLSAFQYEPEKVLYISAVELVSNSSSIMSATYHYDFPTELFSNTNVFRTPATITYKVTVHNNTDVTYWYVGPKALNDTTRAVLTSGNFSITTKDKEEDNSATFNTNDWVPAHATRDFYVVYNFANTLSGDISLLIDFQFGVHIDAVRDDFLAILNDKTSANGYNYLAQVFNEKYAEDGTTVIGNVGDDKAIFDRLFGGNLTVNIDGVETPATVMIQRENVDKNSTGDSYSGQNAPSGCEYTLYITVDTLNSPTGKATVYAISYSCKNSGNNAGTWYQMGQLYEGTATQQDYDPSTNAYEGAFDVNSWIASPKEYVLDDKIIYKVGQIGQGTNYDMLKTIKEIMSTDDQEIYNKIDNSGILKETYNILQNNPFSDADEVKNLRIEFESMAPYYNNYNNGQQFQMKRNATRAEILPYVIRLCEALDYYYQVHG